MKKVFSVLMAVMLLAMSAVPAFAVEDEFVPSVMGVYAPEVVPDGDGDYGKAYSGDDIVVYALDEDDVQTIPLAEADTAAGLLKDELPAAYREIVGAGSLADLLAELNDIADERVSGSSADAFIVTDIFGLQFSDAVKESDLAYVTVTLRCQNYQDGTAPVILFKAVGGDEWIVIDSGDVIVNGDGTLTVSFPAADGVVPVLEQFIPAGPGTIADSVGDGDSDSDDDGDRDSAGDGNGDGAGTGDGHCCRCPYWCFFCRFLCTGSGVCFCWLVLVVIAIIVAIILYSIFKEEDEEEEEEETSGNTADEAQ